MKKFLILAGVLLLAAGCAGRSYQQLAAATHLDMMDRGVVVLNLEDRPSVAYVYVPGKGTIYGPAEVCIEPRKQHAFIILDNGTQDVMVTVQSMNGTSCRPNEIGKPIGRLETRRINLPFGHYVGNAVDNRRNHIMLYYRDGHLTF